MRRDREPIPSRIAALENRVELMSVFSGSAWFDRKPLVLASVLVVEGVHDRFKRTRWAHGVCVRFRRES